MKIISIPDNVLLKKAKPVKVFGAKLRKTIEEMTQVLEACVDPVGVGLAAPQVGLLLRIFLMKPTPKSTTQVFINPTLLSSDPTYKPTGKAREQAEDSLEGCLSIPKIWGPVHRIHKISLEWYDVNGKKHTGEFTDFEAVIIQHELDHLEGVLFTHRSTEQHAPLYEERGKKLYEMTL